VSVQLRQLRYAMMVARERSFTRAATRLNVSQSAISEQVQLLEREIGFDLFTRTGRGVEVTDTGRQFLHEAERVLGDMMNLTEVARRLKGVGTDTLSLGLASGLADHVLPLLLADGQVPPDSRLEIRTAPTRLLFEQLQDRQLDVAISVEVEPGRLPAGLAVTRLAEIPLVLVVPPEHRFARAATAVDLASVADEPVLMSELAIGYGEIVGQLFRDAGLVPRTRAVIDNIDVMKVAVQAGWGIALMPQASVRLEVAHGALACVPLRPARPVPIGIYRSRSLPRRKAAIVGRIVAAASAGGKDTP
jgi:DNA-binding transcriptional LysR family regulator